MPKRLIAELEARIATLEAELGECVTKAAGMIGTDAEMAAGPNHGVVLAALDWLHGQKATLEAELAEDSALRTRMGDILTLTVNALRGEPDSRSLHDWATLPEVARALVAHANALREALEKVHKFLLSEYGYSGGEALFRGEVIEAGARPTWEAVCNALAQTPAQSLGALDAEVLERAATCAEAFLWNLPAIQSQVGANCGDAIRALAAQEVKP